jgi:RimJ/RimL family protein N-acetyltransferase
MSPEFQIITRGFVLRLIKVDESQKLSHCINHSPSLYPWIDWCHSNFSQQEAEAFVKATRLSWIKGEAYGFGVFSRDNSVLLGMVAINEIYHTFNMASIGYWIADEHQKNGLGTNAVKALLEFCFAELSLTRVEVVCDPENNASQKLIISCGGVFETMARNRFIYNGKAKTGAVYSIIQQ